MNSPVLPNVLYIGLARSGSTWLSEALRHHPEVYVPSAKDLYFFDREYERGVDWYGGFFSDGAEKAVRIEFSHDYFHVPFVPARVRATLGDPRLVLTLREPVSWVISNYMNMGRNGQTKNSIGWVMSEHMGLVASALYSQYLAMWLTKFPLDAFSIFLFDDLRADAAGFYRDVLDRLDLGIEPVPTKLSEPVNVAAAARWGPAARLVRTGGLMARRMGRPELVGRVKRMKFLQRGLYRETDVELTVEDDVREALRGFFRDDVHRLSELTEIDLISRWNY